MDQRIQLDLTKYTEQKERGNIVISKVGDKVIIQVKRYSPETGEQTDSFMQEIKREALLDTKANLQAQMNAIDAMIADIDAL